MLVYLHSQGSLSRLQVILSEMLCGPPMDNDTTRGRGFCCGRVA